MSSDSSEQAAGRTHRKPHSSIVTDGIERAGARGMLRAVGMGDDDWRKPQIGVASSWNEITPCNLSLDRLAKAAKEGVRGAGGFPLEFGTISVSDGISMGHEGMHYSLVSREVIADSVETVISAERLDGSVLLAGCDKSLPGMLMAAARLDLASVFLYAGSTLPGRLQRPRRHDHRRVRGGRRLPGRQDQPRGGRRDRAGDLPGRGCLRRHVHRQHDGLCGRGARACRCRAARRRRRRTRRRDDYAERSGEAVVGLVDAGITARTILTKRGVRERDHRRDGARRLDQRRAAPAGDRPRGRGRARPSTTSTASATRFRTSPT